MSATSSTARRLRRQTAGAALISFPALLLVQAPIDPAAGGTGEVMYTAASEHRGALMASAVLLLVSGMLMIPAVAGILHQARDRGAGPANLGAVLSVLGGFGHAGIAFLYILAPAVAGGERAEMVAYVERLNASPALAAVAFPLILCFGLGVMALAWAAWRAGLVRWWGPALVTAGVLLHSGLPFESEAVTFGVLVVMTAVFGHLGLRVLRMSDEGWDGVCRSGTGACPGACLTASLSAGAG